MMQSIKVGAATLNQIPLDWQHNFNNFRAVLQQAQAEKIRILCCPELAITGYGCEDAFLSANTCQMALQVLEELIPYTQDLFVGLGLPLFYQDALYNTVAIVANGQLLGFVAKQHLANYGIHYEARWFHPWPAEKIVTLSTETRAYPLGDLIFTYDNLKIGFEICEDAWVSERTGQRLASRGVNIILNPSASHFAFYKYPLRQQSVLEGAKRFKVGYIYASLSGNEAGRIIYDGDTMIATPAGFAAVGPRFTFRDYHITAAELEISALTKPMESEPQNAASPHVHNLAWENSPYIRDEEFTRAVALGLFDYLRKSKAQGFVLSLSGGADSSSCACLVYLMIQLALNELGEAEFRKKLQHIALPDNPRDFMKALLFCLYQRTQNNSKITENAAEKLALTLGASYASFSLDNIIAAYCQRIEPLMKRPFSWETDDHALQNIQARARVPGLWLLANAKGALLLSTCNRSEASVGYATMDGDTAGSLAPIAGVSKSFIQHWLQWLEKIGPESLGALPILHHITEQVPKAELRPKEAEQTDEQDLMPYAWLDVIQRLFVLEKLSPLEILEIMRQHYQEADPKQLADAIERFFHMWVRSQWKRERIAVSFHLDIESVDPKTWCRYPVLSGNYEVEIAKMRRSLSQ